MRDEVGWARRKETVGESTEDTTPEQVEGDTASTSDVSTEATLWMCMQERTATAIGPR